MRLKRHVFNFTGFAAYHLGLVKNVVVEGSSRNATGPFEHEQHLLGVRHIAESLYVIADKIILVKQQQSNNSSNINEGNFRLVAVLQQQNNNK